MRGDGRNNFYRSCNFDKKTKRLLMNFREIKDEMLNEGDEEYSNGKVYTQEK
jgi:hypothetical protein